METLVGLRLAEGGGFKVASQQRRSIRAALEAAAPFMLAEVRGRIVAHLEDRGGDYDLQYSASISKLADDLVRELAP